MYYCEEKKGNYATYYGVMGFMIDMFEEEVKKGRKNGDGGVISWGQGEVSKEGDVDGLNLSFSHNDDSTLKDILL